MTPKEQRAGSLKYVPATYALVPHDDGTLTVFAVRGHQREPIGEISDKALASFFRTNFHSRLEAHHAAVERERIQREQRQSIPEIDLGDFSL